MKKKPSGMTGGVKRKTPLQEAWVKAIPYSANHGAGIQKKLWRLISDYVRIRDWYKYGVCVATGVRIEHWKEGHAGHFKAYSKCNGMFKFDERNVHLQSPRSNSWGGYEDWIAYENELLKRYEYGLPEIDKWNLELQGTNITNTMVIEKMRDIIQKMGELKEKPEYYERVISLSTDLIKEG